MGVPFRDRWRSTNRRLKIGAERACKRRMTGRRSFPLTRRLHNHPLIFTVAIGAVRLAVTGLYRLQIIWRPEVRRLRRRRRSSASASQ